MGGKIPKQFAMLGTEPVLARTINLFAAALPEASITVVLPEGYIAFWRNLAARFEIAHHRVTAGGAQRFHSVYNGIASLSPSVEIIAVHDAVRPLLSADMIRRCVECAREKGSAVPVVTPADSFRIIEGESSHATDRSALRAVQTPQVFRADILRRAYECAYDESFTDDASVVEHSGASVALCEGERRNIKITTPDDMIMARAFISDDEDEDLQTAPR